MASKSILANELEYIEDVVTLIESNDNTLKWHIIKWLRDQADHIESIETSDHHLRVQTPSDKTGQVLITLEYTDLRKRSKNEQTALD